MIPLLTALVAASAHAGCDAPSLQAAIARAESSFVEMDQASFDGAAAEARSTLSCMTDVLNPVEAAGFHRLCALDAFLRGDHADAILYFQAVRATQPGYELSTEIAPEGHPLRDDFDRSGQYAVDSRFDLAAPAEGWLQVDGLRSGNAPAGRPFVLQWIDGAGDVGKTAWVEVGAVLPTYPLPAPKPVPVPVPAPAPAPAPVTRKPPVLLYAGAGAAALGLGLYGGAFAVRGSYRDAVQAGDEDRILSTHATTNALTISGLVLLGGGATLAVVGAF